MICDLLHQAFITFIFLKKVPPRSRQTAFYSLVLGWLFGDFSSPSSWGTAFPLSGVNVLFSVPYVLFIPLFWWSVSSNFLGKTCTGGKLFRSWLSNNSICYDSYLLCWKEFKVGNHFVSKFWQLSSVNYQEVRSDFRSFYVTCFSLWKLVYIIVSLFQCLKFYNNIYSWGPFSFYWRSVWWAPSISKLMPF